MRIRKIVGRVLLSALLTLLLAGEAASARAQKLHLPPVTRVTFENGLRVVLMEYRRTPTLTLTALFAGGKGSEPAGKAGVAELTATLLRRGTAKRNAQQIAEQIDFLGGSLDVVAGIDKFAANLSLLSKDMDAGLDLFTDVLRNPNFPAEELERERQLKLAGLQSLPDEPRGLAAYIAQQIVYAGHPYGAMPTASTLKGISRDDVQSLYSHAFVPNRMILVVVGDFSASELLTKLRARFGDWPRGMETLEEAPKVSPAPHRLLLLDKPDATQTQVRLLRSAIPRRSPDYYPAQVASDILGVGFTSRLVDDIRVNRSLTYGISSSFETLQQGGAFRISTFTKTETTRAILDATFALLKKTVQSGFTPGELASHKSALSGRFAIELQTPEALAAELAEIAYYGLPDDTLQNYLLKVNAVSLEDVNRIAKTYFSPDALSIVLVAPAAKVKEPLKGLGDFEIRPADAVGK